MANVDARFGFGPADDGPPVVRPYPITTGYGTGLLIGDPVKLLTDGSIARAAAGDRVLGIFQGCSYIDSNGVPQWGQWVASTTATGIEALVSEARPGKRFTVQSDGSLTQAAVGTLADVVYTHPGSTVYNRSGAELNASSVTTAAATFRIVGKDDAPVGKTPNDWGTNVNVIVEVYESEFSVDEPATPGV